MQVPRLPSRMRPEANIDLIGFQNTLNRGCHLPQQGPQLSRFLARQFPELNAMAEGLHNQCADAKGPNAMLCHPAASAVCPATWEV